MRTQWNTGCKYTRFGQRIIAEYDGDTIRFHDIDRQITGVFITHATIHDEYRLRQITEVRYLHNDYQPDFSPQHLTWKE